MNYFLDSSGITGITSSGNPLDDNSEIQNWFKIRASNGDVIIAKNIDRNIAAIVSLSVIVRDISAPDLQQSTGYLLLLFLLSY